MIAAEEAHTRGCPAVGTNSGLFLGHQLTDRLLTPIIRHFVLVA